LEMDVFITFACECLLYYCWAVSMMLIRFSKAANVLSFSSSHWHLVCVASPHRERLCRTCIPIRLRLFTVSLMCCQVFGHVPANMLGRFLKQFFLVDRIATLSPNAKCAHTSTPALLTFSPSSSAPILCSVIPFLLLALISWPVLFGAS